MRYFLSLTFVIVICMYFVLHFIELVWNSEGLKTFLSITGFIVLLTGLLMVKIRQVILSLILISLSILVALLGTDKAFINLVLIGLRQMRELVAMLLIVPMVGWVIRHENIVKDIFNWSRNIFKNSIKLYAGLLFLSQFLSYFIVVGMIPLIHQFLSSFERKVKSEIWERYKSTVLLRGFALSTLWCISIPSLAYAVEQLGASLSVVILQGLLGLLVGILLATSFLHLYEKRSKVNLSEFIYQPLPTENNDGFDKKSMLLRIFIFLFLFLSLFWSIIILNQITDWGLITVISVVVFIWTFLYFLFTRHLITYFKLFKHYISAGLSSRAQEMNILFVAGLIVVSVNEFISTHSLAEKLYVYVETTPWLNILWILPLIIVSLGQIGLGPLPSVILVVGIVSGLQLPYPPELIVFAITLGSALSFMVSPITMAALLLSGSNKISPWKNTMIYNWKFALIFLLLMWGYIQILEYVYRILL